MKDVIFDDWALAFRVGYTSDGRSPSCSYACFLLRGRILMEDKKLLYRGKAAFKELELFGM